MPVSWRSPTALSPQRGRWGQRGPPCHPVSNTAQGQHPLPSARVPLSHTQPPRSRPKRPHQSWTRPPLLLPLQPASRRPPLGTRATPWSHQQPWLAVSPTPPCQQPLGLLSMQPQKDPGPHCLQSPQKHPQQRSPFLLPLLLSARLRSQGHQPLALLELGCLDPTLPPVPVPPHRPWDHQPWPWMSPPQRTAPPRRFQPWEMLGWWPLVLEPQRALPPCTARPPPCSWTRGRSPARPLLYHSLVVASPLGPPLQSPGPPRHRRMGTDPLRPAPAWARPCPSRMEQSRRLPSKGMAPGPSQLPSLAKLQLVKQGWGQHHQPAATLLRWHGMAAPVPPQLLQGYPGHSAPLRYHGQASRGTAVPLQGWQWGCPHPAAPRRWHQAPPRCPQPPCCQRWVPLLPVPMAAPPGEQWGRCPRVWAPTHRGQLPAMSSSPPGHHQSHPPQGPTSPKPSCRRAFPSWSPEAVARPRRPQQSPAQLRTQPCPSAPPLAARIPHL